MSRDEIKKLIGGIIVAYPNYNPNIQMTVELWESFLADYTYEQAYVSLKTYIATNTTGFAPSIGAIVQGIPIAEQINEMEAWALVSNALRDSTYHAEERFKELPLLVQKVVGSPSNLRNWAQTDITSVENVIQSNFIKTYRGYMDREQKNAKLPQSLRLERQKVERGMLGYGNDGQRDLLGLPECEE